jgi:hypothetical protein
MLARVNPTQDRDDGRDTRRAELLTRAFIPIWAGPEFPGAKVTVRRPGSRHFIHFAKS